MTPEEFKFKLKEKCKSKNIRICLLEYDTTNEIIELQFDYEVEAKNQKQLTSPPNHFCGNQIITILKEKDFQTFLDSF